MMGWVGGISVECLDGAAELLGVGPDILLRALLGSLDHVEDIET